MSGKKRLPPASDLPRLAAPARRALAGAHVMRLSDLTRFTAADVMALHGMGPNAMASIRSAMKAKKLTFATD